MYKRQVLACVMGVIAAKSGLTLGLLSKYSFGKAGTYVPVAIVAITTIGWFSIDAYMIGQSTNALFSMEMCIRDSYKGIGSEGTGDYRTGNPHV